MYGMQAIVGLDESEQMAQYRKDRHNYLLYTSIGSIAVLLLTFILTRMGWQLTRSKRQAQRAQRTYFAASEASLDAFITLRTERAGNKPDGTITAFVIVDTTRRGVELLGAPREALLGRRIDPASQLIARHRSFESLLSVASTGVMDEREWLHERADGSSVWLQRQVVRVDGGLVAIVRDINLRKLADVRRADQNRVLEMIATSTPLSDVLNSMAHLLESQIEGSLCSILLRDEDGLHIKLAAAPKFPDSYTKAVHGALIGPEEGPAGRALHFMRPVIMSDIHAHGETSGPFHARLKAANLEGYQDCWGFPILSHDVVTHGALGALTIYVKASHAPTEAEAESIAMATRIISIAIERSQVEERIRHMANHDSLTGLPNRTLLADRLDQVLLHAQRYSRTVTVIFIDLDNFKLINDSLGHHAGDELLKVVAHRMTSCVRRTDTVVRLGGDEFVIVLFDQAQDHDSVTQTIEKIRQAISEPVELSGNYYQVTCSLGLASYPKDGPDAETLLMNADAAMYHAKELGRNNYQVYTSDLNVKLHDKLRLQEDLRHALARNEFRLVYQPQVDLQTERIFGVEALLRWEHPVNGLVSPAEFIPLAEETGLIIPIGDWVLRSACEQNKAWQDQGLSPMTMSVNVSARQFSQHDWCARVAEALRVTGLDPRYLELEITESVIMLDLEGAVTTMRALEDMGVQMSIDDFGTGYSSLSALKHFPVARLKIDQSFVRALSHGQDDRAIAMAVISLGRQLNLKVIAEGVETHEQLAFLRDNDCNEIQGYHYSKPIPPQEVERLLRAPFTWPEGIENMVAAL
jgi:diguanylate cyclase (GGDEF)-like protein